MKLASRAPGTEGYAEHAAELIPHYEALVFEQHHQAEFDLLPRSVGHVLDIGAGTGVDAAWFAKQGHRVLAVEPTAEFRAAARKHHASPAIEWIDDALPELERVLARHQTFDVIIAARALALTRRIRSRPLPIERQLGEVSSLLLAWLWHYAQVWLR